MKIANLIAILVLITLFLFCLFGALASLEPKDGDIQTGWIIGYGVTGVATLLGLGYLTLPRSRSQ